MPAEGHACLHEWMCVYVCLCVDANVKYLFVRLYKLHACLQDFCCVNHRVFTQNFVLCFTFKTFLAGFLTANDTTAKLK